MNLMQDARLDPAVLRRPTHAACAELAGRYAAPLARRDPCDADVTFFPRGGSFVTHAPTRGAALGLAPSDPLVALRALVGALALLEHADEQPGQGDAHDDRLLDRHDGAGDLLVLLRGQAPGAAVVVAVPRVGRERQRDAEDADEQLE